MERKIRVKGECSGEDAEAAAKGATRRESWCEQVMPPMVAEKTEEESYIMSFSSPVKVTDFLGRG